jgi:hypothetical protein
VTIVSSGCVVASASAQAGWVFASGQRKKAVPILHRTGAEQQRRRHAAAVGDPAGGDDRNAHRIDHRRQQREQSDHGVLAALGVESAAMTARLHALSDDHVGAGGFRGAGLGDGRDRGEPADAARLEPRHKFFRVNPHDRRDDRRPGGEQRLALRVEIQRGHISGASMHFRSPLREKLADLRLAFEVALGRRVGHP